LLERRRIDRALLVVVMEAYLHGTSTRKVDDLVFALGVEAGISKSEIARICAELDGEVAAFQSRSLATPPSRRCRGRHLPQGQGRRAGRLRRGGDRTGVTADGGREVLDLEVGDSDDGAFWTAFLRSLKARGLAGVQLASSEPTPG
jgi:putative transposase